MYSSVSLALVGNNSLNFILRLLTSIELYCNSEFYWKHPILVSFFDNHHKFLRIATYESLVSAILPNEVTDGITIAEIDMLKKECFLNCTRYRWTGFFMDDSVK